MGDRENRCVTAYKMEVLGKGMTKVPNSMGKAHLGVPSNDMRMPQVIFKETHAISLPHPHVKN